MSLVGLGQGRKAMLAAGLWWSATGCAAVVPVTADAQVRVAQTEPEGGSMGGRIVPDPGPSRARVLPRSSHERHASPRPGRGAEGDGLARFDGTWSVSSGGGCPTAGSGNVRIAHGRIFAANGSGRVAPDGSVNTVTTVAGMTVVGRGRIVGDAASGSYRQSDGCSGAWSAVRL